MSYSIMVVDDSEIIRSMIARTIALTKLPVQSLFQAQNGDEALSVLKKEWVDIVFTDLNMPVLNGFDLVKNMKNDVALNDIPVVVITTEGNANRLEELTNLGVLKCIRKPFTPEQIRDIITTALGVWDEKKLN